MKKTGSPTLQQLHKRTENRARDKSTPPPQSPLQLVTSSGFLKEKLSQAIRLNPQYSLRAFATKLEISPSGLSQILSGKKRISLERAHQVARILKLTEQETTRLTLLVQIEGSKNPSVKMELIQKLTQSNNVASGLNQSVYNNDSLQLSLDHFTLITEWYGLATMTALMNTQTKVSEAPLMIARRFKISTIEAGTLIDRLERLELIERSSTGFYQRTQDQVQVRSSLPSEAMRKHYQGITQKLTTAILTQTPSEKSIGSEVFMFDPTQLSELKKLTDQYLTSIQKLAESGKNRTHVYQAIAAAFNLEK